MIFTETNLKDAFIIELEQKEDERGFFARSWDSKIFKDRGLNPNIVQCNVSYSSKKGTLRGMHYQIAPYAEVKLVRCTRGKIFDVIVDLRPNSKTHKQWYGIELTASNHKLLYVPEGFAHGHQSLEDNSELFYQVSQFYMPEYEHGLRWNDPMFEISWPIKSPIISVKDATWKNYAY